VRVQKKRKKKKGPIHVLSVGGGGGSKVSTRAKAMRWGDNKPNLSTQKPKKKRTANG